MAETNMDIRKNPDATAPVLEFSLPKHEIDTDLAVGEFGEVILPVEVVAVSGSMVTFRKTKSARADATFHDESLTQMRDRMTANESTKTPRD